MSTAPPPPPPLPHPSAPFLRILGELQAAGTDSDDCRFVFVHHAYRVPDQHAGVGPRRLHIHGLHEDRDPLVDGVPFSGRVPHPDCVSVLRAPSPPVTLILKEKTRDVGGSRESRAFRCVFLGGRETFFVYECV